MAEEHDERLARVHAERFYAKVHEIAERLRGLADDVGREGANPRVNSVGSPAYGWRFQQVLHIVTWGVANLNLPSLADAASELDRIEGEQRTSEQS
jgi:hypothetical protein